MIKHARNNSDSNGNHAPLPPTAQAQIFQDCLEKVAKSRDKAAFAVLYDHFAPRLKSFFMQGRYAPDIAEELAQETMISVWNNAAQYDPKKARPSTWIFTIGRNRKIDLIRKQNRQEIDPNDPFFIPDVKEDEIENALDLEIQAQRLTKAIKDLPVEQAELIKKSYFEDKPHGEIARETKLPLGTVKSRLRLAMERLRREFERDLKDQGNE